MSRTALALVLGLVMLAATPLALAASILPGAARAAGTEDCGDGRTGDVTLTMARPGPGGPWLVVVQVQGAGCPNYTGVCLGTGTLGSGLALSNCTPTGASGTLGPVLSCQPGPEHPMLTANGGGSFQLAVGAAVGEGTLAYQLYGGAVDEALNPCL